MLHLCGLLEFSRLSLGPFFRPYLELHGNAVVLLMKPARFTHEELQEYYEYFKAGDVQFSGKMLARVESGVRYGLAVRVYLFVFVCWGWERGVMPHLLRKS